MSYGKQYLPSPYLIIKKELDLDMENSKLLKGKTKIELIRKSEENRYAIPEQVKQLLKEYPYMICFDVWEGGGGYTHTGHSTIVCGNSGKKLRPYYVVSHGPRANSEHACFSIPYSCVVVECDSDFDIEMIRIYVKENGDEVEINEATLWKGSSDCLPNKFNKYREAVHAAVDKRACYHCRSPHYAVGW